MAVVLALVSALAYGVSDFVGGILARRVTAWQVAVVGQSSSALFAFLAAFVIGGDPTRSDWLWGALAGLGGGAGAAFLYRGLATGRMSVIAPVSAIGAAIVPVAAGLALGDRPSILAWVGIVFAFPAIVLISQTTENLDSETHNGGIADGVLAGLGFGLLFTFLDQIGADAGLFPLGLAQTTSVLSVIATAVVLKAAWVPREPRAWYALAMGPLGATATGAFVFATQLGLLAIVSVIASLYPAMTVLLAAVILRERIHRIQAIGLVLATAAVTLVALG